MIFSPLGLSQWFNGFCATLNSREIGVAQKPLNHRRKVGGETITRSEGRSEHRFRLDRTGLIPRAVPSWHVTEATSRHHHTNSLKQHTGCRFPSARRCDGEDLTNCPVSAILTGDFRWSRSPFANASHECPTPRRTRRLAKDVGSGRSTQSAKVWGSVRVCRMVRRSAGTVLNRAASDSRRFERSPTQAKRRLAP